MEYFVVTSGIISLIIAFISLRISLKTSRIQKTIESENIYFQRKIDCYEKLTELLVEYCVSVNEVREQMIQFIDNHKDTLQSLNLEKRITAFEEKEKIIGLRFYKYSLLIPTSIMNQLEKFLINPEFKEEPKSTDDWSKLLDGRFDGAEGLINQMRLNLKLPNLEDKIKLRFH